VAGIVADGPVPRSAGSSAGTRVHRSEGRAVAL